MGANQSLPIRKKKIEKGRFGNCVFVTAAMQGWRPSKYNFKTCLCQKSSLISQVATLLFSTISSLLASIFSNLTFSIFQAWRIDSQTTPTQNTRHSSSVFTKSF